MALVRFQISKWKQWRVKKFNAKRKKIEAQKADENDIKELEVSYKVVQKARQQSIIFINF